MILMRKYQILVNYRIETYWVLVLFDCDNIGECNDKYGQEFVDKQLLHVKEEILNICKEWNVICYGYYLDNGDDFGLLINDDINSGDISLSIDIVNGLREVISKKTLCMLTISCGIGRLEENESFEYWEKRVNGNLKLSKQYGKNQINWGQIQQKEVCIFIILAHFSVYVADQETCVRVIGCVYVYKLLDFV